MVQFPCVFRVTLSGDAFPMFPHVFPSHLFLLQTRERHRHPAVVGLQRPASRVLPIRPASIHSHLRGRLTAQLRLRMPSSSACAHWGSPTLLTPTYFLLSGVSRLRCAYGLGSFDASCGECLMKSSGDEPFLGRFFLWNSYWFRFGTIPRICVIESVNNSRRGKPAVGT